MASPSKYAETGVDVSKKGIEAFKATVKNLFPNAFCVVTQDPDFPEYGLVTHQDSNGSKPIMNYLLWKETGDISYLEPMAQDVIAMNLDDIICVGAKPISFTDYVAINGFTMNPKTDVLAALNRGFGKVLGTLEKYGVNMPFGGGETADLPYQVRTIDVSGTAVGRVKLSNAITGSEISPGNLIVGLYSGGQTAYEDTHNSGIMCNGITLARQVLTPPMYAEKYPEIVEPRGKAYEGRFDILDLDEELGMRVGEAVISPTRLFAPAVARVLEDYGHHVSGMVHNTGGGQTKCLRLGKNVHYVKHDVLEVDPIFYLIQREGKVPWEEMFQDYNMGVGFELIVNDKDVVDDILDIAEKLGLEGGMTGYVERSDGENKLTIHTDLSPAGKFHYKA